MNDQTVRVSLLQLKLEIRKVQKQSEIEKRTMERVPV